MSVPDNYEIIQTTSTDAQIRVDIDWEYDSITDLYIWQQDTDTGVITYFNLGDFAVVEKSDGSGDYIEVENVSNSTAIINTARRSPLTQTYDLLNSEALDPVALVDALDKAIKILQEQDAITLTPDRQVITSVNPFDIPDKVTRAGKLLSFDENGDVQFTTSDEALDEAIGYAEEWAKNPEDQLVSAGAGGNQVDDYSALHHAKKSEGFSQDSEGHATNSENSATNSQNSATASSSSATASSSSATDSFNSATDAFDSATDALVSENKANQWAEEAEDVEVETGQYSAKHWANKAEDATKDKIWAHVTNGNQISPTISDGVGISSIQRLSKGQYTFFLSSPVSSASPNIIIDFTPVAFTGSSSVIQYDKSISSASTIYFVAYDLAGNLTDSTEFLISIRELT